MQNICYQFRRFLQKIELQTKAQNHTNFFQSHQTQRNECRVQGFFSEDFRSNLLEFRIKKTFEAVSEQFGMRSEAVLLKSSMSFWEYLD